MSNVLGSLFGRTSDSSAVSAAYTNPLSFSGRGTSTPLGQSTFNVDPSSNNSFINLPAGISQQRQGLFGQTQGLGTDVQGDINTLRSNENPFIQARVRSTAEKFANLRAETERGLARRGVTGTLANNELMRVDQAASREIADQTAKAQSEALDSILQRQDFQRVLLSSLRGYTQDEVTQAMNELQILSGQTATSFNTVQNSGQVVSGERQASAGPGLGSLIKTGRELYDWFS